jgi:hypothetical protein
LKSLSSKNLIYTLKLLDEQLGLLTKEKFDLVVCGGSALIALDLVNRTTKDIDVIASIKNKQMVDPEPLPECLVKAAAKITNYLNLPKDWINTGPADLFRMGLPEGFFERLVPEEIGEHLAIHFISRIDQIYFKLYASVDRGGYHITDLMLLKPENEEILQAAKWTCLHDVSQGYLIMLKRLLKELGYESIINKI